MEIKFIGVGGAFDTNYINSSAIVTLNGKRYLVDCGHSVFPQLVQKGVADKIDAVIITHLHDDHIGSLSSFAFYTYHMLGRKLKILLPDHTTFKEKFFQLVSLTMVRYQNYLDFVAIDKSEIEPIETTNLHSQGMETFSFLFYEGNQMIAYSGDLGHPDFLFQEIGKRNINTSTLTIFHDTSFYRNTAHAYYQDLMKWKDQFNIYSYHCNPEQNPSDNMLPLVFNSPYFL
ncbi:MAG TPA: MBL fold metallo-hydrolase [Cytophagales bacterium]|nr:MBL fold metallo-hydrolase [Cytophagales bacterium]